MTQRAFFDDEEPRPRVKKRAIPLASALTFEELVGEMQTLLHIKTAEGGPWHARARGCSKFGCGSDPQEAMENALRVRAQEKA
jgi:hypothetical protein